MFDRLLGKAISWEYKMPGVQYDFRGDRGGFVKFSIHLWIIEE